MTTPELVARDINDSLNSRLPAIRAIAKTLALFVPAGPDQQVKGEALWREASVPTRPCDDEQNWKDEFGRSRPTELQEAG